MARHLPSLLLAAGGVLLAGCVTPPRSDTSGARSDACARYASETGRSRFQLVAPIRSDWYAARLADRAADEALARCRAARGGATRVR